jgi:hypothetical protein
VIVKVSTDDISPRARERCRGANAYTKPKDELRSERMSKRLRKGKHDVGSLRKADAQRVHGGRRMTGAIYGNDATW